MKKYILPIFIFAGLFYSCGYDNYQSAQDYLDQFINKKWSSFAESIGFPKDDLKGVFDLATDPTEAGIKASITKDLTEKNPQTSFMKVDVYTKTLNQKVFAHWGKGLTQDELIASNFEQHGNPEVKDGHTVYIMTYDVNIKVGSKTEQRKNVAYLSIPKGDIKGHPVVYFHKDDRGLSYDLMKQEVGEKVLNERLVIAPAGSGQAISTTYTPRKDPTDIIAKSTHTDALPWSDTVDDAISLLRGLRKEAISFMVPNPPQAKFPFIDIQGKDWQILAEKFGSRTFDFLGFSTGGLTAGLVASKVGGYINQEALLKIQMLTDDAKKVEVLTNLLNNKYSFFIQKLILVSSPTSFIHGFFRVILQAFVTGEVENPTNHFHNFKEFPGLRHAHPLFDKYRNALPGSVEETTERDLLSQEVLSRDLTFQIGAAIGGAMNGKVLKTFSLGKPQIAILHHMQDGMIQLHAGSLPLIKTVKDNAFQKFLETELETEFYLYKRDTLKFEDKTPDQKEDPKYHLEDAFWDKTTSVNKEGNSPREVLDEILSPDNKK